MQNAIDFDSIVLIKKKKKKKKKKKATQYYMLIFSKSELECVNLKYKIMKKHLEILFCRFFKSKLLNFSGIGPKWL